MKDGELYFFDTPDGDPKLGIYEELSGNFFVGGNENYNDHKECYEASSCKNIKPIS